MERKYDLIFTIAMHLFRIFAIILFNIIIVGLAIYSDYGYIGNIIISIGTVIVTILSFIVIIYSVGDFKNDIEELL